MLSGKFKNCYGLQDFELKEINFGECNKSIIYSPNGIMKTSLAKVFEDISKGNKTTDRIFTELISEYIVNYYATTYNHTDRKVNERIYVVNSFNDGFELPKESVTTLLADAETRKQYDKIVSAFSAEIKEFQDNLSKLSGITKPKIKGQLLSDYNLTDDSDWTDIFDVLDKDLKSYSDNELFDNFKYIEIFNDKTEKVYSNPIFKEKIDNYIETLKNLLNENELLSDGFDDYNAEELGKSLDKHNLFKAKHSITLKDGVTTITDVKDWKKKVSDELDKVYNKPELSRTFNELKKILTANADVKKLRDIITQNREIIKLFADPDMLKKSIWLHNLLKLDKGFYAYSSKVIKYKEDIKSLYERASEQKEYWEKVVEEFNNRFKVPFTVGISNQANVLLKDEAPNIYFTYYQNKGTANERKVDYGKNELMSSLSMGERRAMYLLYILFDLERIKSLATSGSGKYLIIADDIADSFDYKNKYAIIEYLCDLSQSRNIDLLVLTHNFDFYRTIMSRLNVKRQNCYIVQKGKEESIIMSEFKYRNDFFNNVIMAKIKDGKIGSDTEKRKCLIASIPFYRNLSEYIQEDNIYKSLTCFLHLKDNPVNTRTAKISDLWYILKDPFNLNTLEIDDDSQIIDTMKALADDICLNLNDEVLLENKIILAMAIRLEAEIFLEKVLDNNGIDKTCSSIQTRDWTKKAKPYLSTEEMKIIDSVNVMTPESIHVNTFMYEPIIDMSDWSLKRLYEEVKGLN